MQTNPTSGISTSKNGPHTVSDIGLKKAIVDMKDEMDLEKEYENQVPKYEVIKDIVNEEKGDLKEDKEFSFDEKMKRHEKDYLHNQSMWKLTGKVGDNEKRKRWRRYILYEGINLHPYGTYGWNLKEPTKHKDYRKWLKGKGERANSPPEKLVDKGYEELFVKKALAKLWVEKREKMLDYRLKKSEKMKKKRKRKI